MDQLMERLYAPFSSEQVAALNRFQSGNLWHPFTCRVRDRKGHQFRWGDIGTLVAQPKGMSCPDCGYLQTWVYQFMADPEWLDSRNRELRT